MKEFLIILLVIVIVLVGRNYLSNLNKTDSNNSGYKKISAEEAKEIIDNEDVIILDVRTKEEYNGGHIENSVLLPVANIPDKAESVLADKDAKILIYCRSGNRSANAARQLIKMGYTNVYDFGGIIDWPYDIVK